MKCLSCGRNIETVSHVCDPKQREEYQKTLPAVVRSFLDDDEVLLVNSWQPPPQ